ncbi:MAG: hypothetical protein HY259_10430 [Chloroflexi bacterium]|nr:hypothetical protein [Chloroflexota bacterium]MBI3733854.1 hypothetical protein [Chloroflexota bacterium]
MLTFDVGREQIAQTAKHFHINRAQFLAPQYKEAHARQELIDPLFRRSPLPL